MKLKTKCHPEANGRSPIKGETTFTLVFPLEDGNILEIEMGQYGFDNITNAVARWNNANGIRPLFGTATDLENIASFKKQMKAHAEIYAQIYGGKP